MRLFTQYSVKFKSCALGLSDLARQLRQKEYYNEPRFHASIAWALQRGSGQPDARFPTIESFPETLLSDLNAEFGSRLNKVGTFRVEKISAKIGKETFSWKLLGEKSQLPVI